MSEMVGKMQARLKQSSGDIFTFLLKAVSGLVLALTFALIIHEVLGKRDGEGLMSFVFLIVVFTSVFLRLAKKWSLITVLVFDLVCILVGIILRLYIMVAPGS